MEITAQRYSDGGLVNPVVVQNKQAVGQPSGLLNIRFGTVASFALRTKPRTYSLPSMRATLPNAGIRGMYLPAQSLGPSKIDDPLILYITTL